MSGKPRLPRSLGEALCSGYSLTENDVTEDALEDGKFTDDAITTTGYLTMQKGEKRIKVPFTAGRTFGKPMAA